MKLKFFLGVFSLLFILIGFFAEEISHLQFFEEIILQQQQSAKKGIILLKENGTLESKDVGFSPLSKLLFEKFSIPSPNHLHIISFVDKMEVSPSEVGMITPIGIIWSDSSETETSFEELSNLIDISSQQNMWIVRLIVFTIGFVINLFVIISDFMPDNFINFKKNKKKKMMASKTNKRPI